MPAAAEARRLLLHGTGVFAFSTWAVGMAQAAAATKRRASEGQWRTAHTGGTMHAVFLFAMAGCIREFSLSDADRASLSTNAILMGWCNSLGYAVGAALGKRGLEFTGLDSNLPPLVLFLTAMYALAKVLQLSWRGAALGGGRREEEEPAAAGNATVL